MQGGGKIVKYSELKNVTSLSNSMIGLGFLYQMVHFS